MDRLEIAYDGSPFPKIGEDCRWVTIAEYARAAGTTRYAVERGIAKQMITSISRNGYTYVAAPIAVVGNAGDVHAAVEEYNPKRPEKSPLPKELVELFRPFTRK